MRTIQSEFPGWNVDKLVIPPFVCEPWHNDAAIRYVYRGNTDDLADCELTLWHDHPDPTKRENEGVPRYWLSVGVTDEIPIAAFWGETEDELRLMLSVWHEEHVGYRPDNEGQPLPLGELMAWVGIVAFLQSTGKEQ